MHKVDVIYYAQSSCILDYKLLVYFANLEKNKNKTFHMME